jgi:outer membrane lipoprotein-sorting protein
VLLRRAALALMAALVALPVLAGCTGGGSGDSATELLAKAKKTLDATKTVHFVLSSTGAPSTGTILTGGEGDIARPSSFQGTLKVQAVGSTVNLKVISDGGTVYAQLPFAQTYSTIDPASFGFGDPGKLLDPKTGISQLLTATTNAKLGDEKRVNGVVVREVTGQLPGDLVQKLLTSKDPSKPVQARYSIATDSGQLLRAALTGPFFDATQNGTYTLDLSKYGADVTITAPPTS